MDEATIESFQAQSHLYKHVFSFIGSMSVKCCVQLGIPDIIQNHGQPITISELVSALGIDPAKTSCIYRLMRMLVHSGFFAYDQEKEAYDLTSFSKILVKDKINCLSPFVTAILDPVVMTPWQFLGDWLQGTEQGPFEIAYGKPFWAYMDDDTRYKNLFHGAMESDSQMMNLVIKECKPVFEGLNSLVDAGGGTGGVARVISDAFPQLKCTVFDLPHIVGDLTATSTEKLSFVGGDLLQHVPSADAILLKLVFHAYGDDDCIKILKRCREAIPSQGGKLIVIDIVINDEKDENELTEAKLFFDLSMMVFASGKGKERTEGDWEKLFKAAGFSDYKISPLFGLRSLIEVYP